MYRRVDQVLHAEVPSTDYNVRPDPPSQCPSSATLAVSCAHDVDFVRVPSKTARNHPSRDSMTIGSPGQHEDEV